MRTEVDVPSILKKDGVENITLDDCNKSVVNVFELMEESDESYSKTIVNSDSNSVTMICQNPNEGNRRHYHPDWNEWWFIVKGKWEFEIEGSKTIVKTGDIVFIPKNKKHCIKAVGNEQAIRLAVSRYDVEHIYED